MPQPPTGAIRAVIFDCGNVLCRFDNGRFLEGLAELCGRRIEGLEAALYGASGLSEAYESGRIGSRAFLEGVSALCGTNLPEAAFIRAFTDIFTPLPGTFDLVRRLKPRYRLGMLSNTSPWHVEHAIRHFEVFPLFDTVTLSYEVGRAKPDPRIFEDALLKLGLEAGACVYIDDIPAFAQAATSLGLHGLTFITPEALAADLEGLGLRF